MRKAIVCVLLAAVFCLLGSGEIRQALTELAGALLPAARENADGASPQEEPLFRSAEPPAAADTLEVTLYYRYGRTGALGMERAQLDIRRDETIARSIVELLVAGPDNAHGRLNGVFPQGTRVLSVMGEGTTVYVTLSDAFLGAPDEAPADWEDSAAWQQEATLRRWLAAQSIVCALTEGGRYQRVQLYVAGGDDEAPERIPLYWFDQSVSDPSVVLAAMSRDETAMLTPARVLETILQGWKQRDWELVYTLLCAPEGGQMPTQSAFEAQMWEADVSLLTSEVSGGTIDATGRTATLVLDGAIRSAGGGDARIIRESVPLVRVDDNWAMRVDTLLSLMIRE